MRPTAITVPERDDSKLRYEELSLENLRAGVEKSYEVAQAYTLKPRDARETGGTAVKSSFIDTKGLSKSPEQLNRFEKLAGVGKDLAKMRQAAIAQDQGATGSVASMTLESRHPKTPTFELPDRRAS